MDRDDELGRNREERIREMMRLQHDERRSVEKPREPKEELRDGSVPQMKSVDLMKEERKAQAQVEVEIIRSVGCADENKWSKLGREERQAVLQEIEFRVAPFQARDAAWVVWTNQRKWKHEWSDLIEERFVLGRSHIISMPEVSIDDCRFTHSMLFVKQQHLVQAEEIALYEARKAGEPIPNLENRYPFPVDDAMLGIWAKEVKEYLKPKQERVSEYRVVEYAMLEAERRCSSLFGFERTHRGY